MFKVYCDIFRCLSCRTCEVECAVRHSEGKTLMEALREKGGVKQLVRVRHSVEGPFPLRCHHCEDAACIDACKTGATYRDPATGRVLIDKNKCVGCWMCVMVCPFGAVFPNEETGKALKCDLCEGHEKPACVAGCPTLALHYEEFSDFERQHTKRKKGSNSAQKGRRESHAIRGHRK